MSIASLAPDYIRAIMAYQPGKPISELAREMGIAEESIVKLASNENPLGMSVRARDAAITAIGEISRYPDGGAFALKKALCARFGVEPAQLVIGNGSNDILELASQAFLAPGLSAVYSRHAFAVYPLATNARGARGIEVAAKNFGHDLDAMAAAIEPQTRVVFIANPNNPTGTFVPGAELEAFLAEVPRHVLVV
ncbi:MAG: aminotransferase class I/II-fold pyridoxal phosphate-dependent enzyme, partial [Thauera sp.]|nr:aminotransferase class I/II-fold pyridoxal phosphate-dependent enzyme [Thauera sp.]